MFALFKRLSSSAAGVFVLAFYKRFNDANVALLAAGLAYYAAFSLGPLTLIFTSFLAGFLQNRPDLAAEYQTVLIDLLKQVLPVQVDSQALIVNSINVVVSQMGDGAIFRNLLSFLILLWAGTNFFTVLQLALEVIFDIENARAYWRKRIVAIVLLVAVALVIAFEVFWSLFSSFLTGVWLFLVDWFSTRNIVLPISEFGQGSVTEVLRIGIAVFVFSLCFHYLPRQASTWGAAFLGAFLYVLSLRLLQVLFGQLFNPERFSLIYGIVTGLLVILLWLYLSLMLFLLAAVLVAVLSNYRRDLATIKRI